jgi:hypothetical protein
MTQAARCTFLFSIDKTNGKNYERSRQWIQDPFEYSKERLN